MIFTLNLNQLLNYHQMISDSFQYYYKKVEHLLFIYELPPLS